MVKCKIFFGTARVDDRADIKFNEWSEKHPHALVEEFIYRQARMGDHSICIVYHDNEMEER